MAVDSGLIAYAVICFVIVLCFTGYLVWYYARPKTPAIVLFFTFIGWLATFSICFITPIDLLPPEYSVDLTIAWSVLYWSGLLLSWLVIPLLSGYYMNGGFNFKQKLLLSLRLNLILFTLILSIFCVGIIYLRAVDNYSWTDITSLLIVINNVFGLLVLTFLAGYGLSELPRNIYYNSNVMRKLDECYYNAATIHAELDDTRDELAATVKLVRAMEPHINSAANINSEIRVYYGIIENELHVIEHEMQQLSRRAHPFELALAEELKHKIDGASHRESSNIITVKYLQKVHFHVKSLTRHFISLDAQWVDSVEDSAALNRHLGYEVSLNQGLLGVSLLK
jgi:hypothetical protein